MPNLFHWGWKEWNGKLKPKQREKNVASSNLLKLTRCNCKSLKNMCSTNQCTCKRYSLKCVPAFGKCRSEVCKINEKVIGMTDY